MSRHSAGTPSPAGYGSLNHQIQLSAAIANLPGRESLPSSIARLTMTNVVGIDVAVAQATQTPQQLQKQQAALYGGMGAMYMPTQSGAILDSILAIGQPHQQTRTAGAGESWKALQICRIGL